MLIPDGCTGRINTTPTGDFDGDEYEQELVHDGPCPVHLTASDVAAGHRALADFLEGHPVLAENYCPGAGWVTDHYRTTLAHEFVDGADAGEVTVFEYGLVRSFGVVELRLYMGREKVQRAVQPVKPVLKSVHEVLAALAPVEQGSAA